MHAIPNTSSACQLIRAPEQVNNPGYERGGVHGVRAEHNERETPKDDGHSEGGDNQVECGSTPPHGSDSEALLRLGATAAPTVAPARQASGHAMPRDNAQEAVMVPAMTYSPCAKLNTPVTRAMITNPSAVSAVTHPTVRPETTTWTKSEQSAPPLSQDVGGAAAPRRRPHRDQSGRRSSRIGARGQHPCGLATTGLDDHVDVGLRPGTHKPVVVSRGVTAVSRGQVAVEGFQRGDEAVPRDGGASRGQTACRFGERLNGVVSVDAETGPRADLAHKRIVVRGQAGQ